MIIEGLEKAERNILPILVSVEIAFLTLQNNLLENREMSLEDGSFLMNAKQYDELVNEKGYTKQQMDELRLIRVDPKFRIVALSLPVKTIF